MLDLDGQLLAAQRSELDTYDSDIAPDVRLQRILAQVLQVEVHIEELRTLVNRPDPTEAPGPVAAALVRAAQALQEGRAACYADVRRAFVASPAGASMGDGYDVFAANDAIEAYVVAAAQEMGPDIEGEVRRLMGGPRRRRRGASRDDEPPARRRRTRPPSPSPSPSPPPRRRQHRDIMPAARMGDDTPQPSPSSSPEPPRTRRATQRQPSEAWRRRTQNAIPGPESVAIARARRLGSSQAAQQGEMPSELRGLPWNDPRRIAFDEEVIMRRHGMSGLAPSPSPSPSPSPERRPRRRAAQRQQPPPPPPQRRRARPSQRRDPPPPPPTRSQRRARREAAPAPTRPRRSRRNAG